MDLSGVEGLTPEQVTAITAQHTLSTEGLANKNAELLNEKKTVQQRLNDESQALEDSRLAAVKANEDALKAAGDMEGLKAHYESQLAESTAAANANAEKATQALQSRDKGEALNSALSLIHDDYKGISTAMLSNMIDISYNEKGETLTTYTDNGKVVANNAEEFKSWASEQPAFSKILNGVNSSGANTTQSRGSASTGNDAKSNLARRLKGHCLN